MASQPKQKKINCKATVFFVDNKGESKKCGRITLKGNDGEFNKIMQKAREVCSKSVCGDTPTLRITFDLFALCTLLCYLVNIKYYNLNSLKVRLYF